MPPEVIGDGAAEGTRTLDIHLGKLTAGGISPDFEASCGEGVSTDSDNESDIADSDDVTTALASLSKAQRAALSSILRRLIDPEVEGGS